MTTKSCGRNYPHHEHDWTPTRWSPGYRCPGLKFDRSRGLRFTMGEDARAGDVVTVDDHGVLVRERKYVSPHMSYEAAEDFAWQVHPDAEALASLSDRTFAQAADELVKISDLMRDIR